MTDYFCHIDSDTLSELPYEHCSNASALVDVSFENIYERGEPVQNA